jgi:hypothetical protein
VIGRLMGREIGRQSLAGMQKYIQGAKQMHSRQRHSCWRRQGETGRQAEAGMHTEAWRQKLAGKGRETGSQAEASKQASRMRQRSTDTSRQR